jgi:catechol 2,3-dioxygenase-like lactoylglutathione lyase family enzyme
MSLQNRDAHENRECQMNLNTARVFVRDIEKAKQFYSKSLGLPIKADGAAHGYCVFDAGNSELVVESVASDAPQEDQVLVGRFTGLSFQVSDVHKKHKELAARGVEFSGLPEKQFWGGTLATLRDPDGNEIQIVHRQAA